MSKLPHPKTHREETGLESPPGPLTKPQLGDEWSKLRTISLRSVHAPPKSFCQWHSHPFDELCLTTDGTTLMGHAGRLVPAAANTLFHYRPGEEHAFWNDDRQQPRFWVVHFTPDARLQAALPALSKADPKLRPCQLTVPQVETFKWLFMRLSVEHSQRAPSCAVAEAAWMHLLLVNVDRWARHEFATSIAPATGRPEIMRLWQMIQDSAGRPAEFADRIKEIPNYNSLRGEFTKVFGVSPTQMALRTRIQIARNLLVETPLSMKQIAEELGYLRQHEFTRAFHRVTGVSPTAWRENPI
ncbi:MAG: helix-turn-helix domain-containing protein [Opitutaceae bacterium]